MWVFNLIMVMMLFVLGIVNGITPYYSRRGTPFGITVPGQYQNHPFIQQRKKSFFVQNILLSVVLSIPVFFFSEIEDKHTQETWTNVYFIAAIFIFLILTFGLYLSNRKAIQRWKKKNNISVDPAKERIVVDTRYHKDLKAVSTRSIVFAQLGIIFITTAIIWLFYDAIPNEFPIHWNSQNIPDRVVEKSYLSVFMMPAIQLLLVPVMAFSHYSFITAKQKLLSNYPQLTSKQSKQFRRAWSFYFLVVSAAMQLLLMFITFFSLFFAEDVGMGWMSLVIALFVFGVIGYSLFLTWKYGQGGEKLVYSEINELSDEVTEVDEEKYWKWGIFYYNPEDPAIFVEKRFGIGTTINMARWQSWACIGGIILFCILMGVFSALMG